MADDSATRVRRHRAHARGDHRQCRRDSCPDAGTWILDGTVQGLQRAVQAEYASADPVSRALALHLVSLAGEGGSSAVAATRALGELVAAQPFGEVRPR
jgi:hypothetical protein